MHCHEINRHIEAFRAAGDFGRLRQVLDDVKRGLGFDHFALVQGDGSRTDGVLILLQDYHDAFVNVLAESFASNHSPILHLAGRTSSPFRWDEIHKLVDLSVAQRTYLRLAADHDLVHGYTIPIHIPGEPSGLVSFVNGRDNPIRQHVLPSAQFMASHAFDAARRLLRHASRHGEGSDIGDTDRHVITLLARGKSRWTIARKLGVSEASVGEVILKARRHYRVNSHAEMVVRALYDRTIVFDDVMR